MSKLGNILTNVVVFGAGFIVGAACYAAAIEASEASDEKYFDDLDTDDLDDGADDFGENEKESDNSWDDENNYGDHPAEFCEAPAEESDMSDRGNISQDVKPAVEEALAETIEGLTTSNNTLEESTDSSNDEK